MSATTKRRGRGDGSIYTDSRGRVVGEISIDGKRYRVIGKTKTDTRARLRALIAAPPEVVKTTKLTVADVLDDFLSREVAGRDLAPSTVVRHEWAAGQVRTVLAKRRVAELTVRDVDDMLDRLAADRKLSRSSLTKVRGTLSMSLRFAVRRGDLDRDVASLATIPPSAARTKPRRSLTPEDARTLLVALREERNGLMFALSLRLGLRPGEAAGIYWEDLHGDTLNVTRGVRLDHGTATVSDDLKTATSKRTIQLPADVLDWITEHRRAQTTERLAARTWIDERLMFASPTGNVLSPPNVRRQLDAICERAGIPMIRPNELRHSCASLLSDIGVANELIADLLGHTTTRMVDQTYRHRLRPVVSVAVEADWTAQA